jgi:hypothetical protein
MTDSRSGGIEKIAHLFIAGNGAASARARDRSPLLPAGPPGTHGGGPGVADGDPTGDGNGNGSGGVREAASAPPAADKKSAVRGFSPAPGATVDAEGAAGTGPGAGESPGGAGGEAAPTSGPAAAGPPPSRALIGLQSVLCRARVAAVLSGHMGPLAGPAAELVAKTLAREGTRVAMLYGPADFACLHRFSARPADEAGAANGNGQAAQGPGVDTAPCDALLLPDWVFQCDLWPSTRGIHAVCLAYGAGSDGLMSAYGALKGLIARFGKPEELLLLPFGCSEQEEAWTRERLMDMCRRFLELEPRLAREKPDMRVHASKLMPIDGGSEGVKQLFDAIGHVKLMLVPPPEPEPEPDRAGAPKETAAPDEALQEHGHSGDRSQIAAEVTTLIPIRQVPRDGEAVLRALVDSLRADGNGFFDVWGREGVAGTILGRAGLIGAAGRIGDLLGFALWLCRQAKVNDLDDLTSITIAAGKVDSWLIEAARAMPVPVHWVSWRAFELGGNLGMCFEPADAL